jgi:cobalt/nickel transport system permease protein
MKHILITLFFLFSFFFLTENLHAMHISEGILPFSWSLLSTCAAIPFLAYGLSELKKKSTDDISFKPLVGIMAAVVFIISCMPVPVPTAGTCSHPCGTGISAILLGPFLSSLIASVALLLQALFLAHGGISTWGANVMSMGIAGSFAGFLGFKISRKFGVNLYISAFMAGILADWATYTMTSLELSLGIRGNEPFFPLFRDIFIAFIPTQLPIGILEGALTAGMVALLYNKRADLLLSLNIIKENEARA